MATVNSQTIQQWNDFKQGRLSAGFLRFKIEKGDIKVDKIGDKYENYEDFIQNEFDPKNACYIGYHFVYYTKENSAKRVKTIIYQWIPAEANAKDKMSYAMSSSKLKGGLEGIHSFVQSCSIQDLQYETVLERVSRFEK